MIEINNLKKTFENGSPALKGVDLKINKGFIENYLLAKNILRLKWKTNIIAVAAVAIAKPSFP